MEKFIISSIKIFFWIIFGSLIRIITTNLKTSIITYFIKYLINIIVFGLVPFFVIINIWKYGLSKETLIPILIVFCFILIISYLIAKYITKNYNLSLQEVFFPLAFMNTLYLGVPVTQYFVSLKATYYAIIYSIIVTIIQFSFGIYILKKRFVANYIIFLLILVGFFLAFLLDYFNIEIPKLLIKVQNLISYFLSPLMLCFIGYSIKWNNLIQNIRLHIFTNLVKTVIIFLTSVVILYILNIFFSLEQEFIKSIVLISILPSAIINYIILEKLNIDINFTVGEIFWGTATTLFLLPYLSEILDIILLLIK